MADIVSLLKGFQATLGSYQDIGTIYGKLEGQGHLEKLVTILFEIYNDEHEFTLNGS